MDREDQVKQEEMAADTASAEAADTPDTKETEAAQNEESSKEAAEAADGEAGAQAEPENPDSTGSQKPEKKGFFKKKEKEKDSRDQKIEELTDQLRRNMAEFDNFRKRTEKEKSAMFEMGARDILEKILPVVDNFERGLASIPEEAKGTV